MRMMMVIVIQDATIVCDNGCDDDADAYCPGRPTCLAPGGDDADRKVVKDGDDVDSVLYYPQ